MATDRTETGKPAARAEAALVMHLVVSLDGSDPTAAPGGWSLAGTRRVSVGRGSERRAERKQGGAGWVLQLELADSQISREHGVLERADGGWRFTDRGSRNGSWLDGVRCQPSQPVALQHGSRLQLARTLLVMREIAGGDRWPPVAPHPSLETLVKTHTSSGFSAYSPPERVDVGPGPGGAEALAAELLGRAVPRRRAPAAR